MLVFAGDQRCVTVSKTTGRAFEVLEDHTTISASLVLRVDTHPQDLAGSRVQAPDGQYVRDVLTWTLTGQTPPHIRLDWSVDQAARDALEDRVFGKRFLITDRPDQTVGEVVAGYRSQSEAELGFRQLKDPHVVSFSPTRHHTDAQIRVHVFCCVLALMIAHLMRRQAAHAGMQMSVRGMLDALAGIQQTVLLYPGDRGRPQARHMITDMDDTQQTLFEIFELHPSPPFSITFSLLLPRPAENLRRVEATQDQKVIILGFAPPICLTWQDDRSASQDARPFARRPRQRVLRDAEGPAVSSTAHSTARA
jgi:hypothetical protein